MISAASVKRYAAFISYRHLSPDMEIAEALHKMLEHNRVRPNRHTPRNIRPVFIDRGELPLLESLEDGIKAALENSECLIVICSPNLPLSKYCMKEIEYFKQLHGGRVNKIFTLLVAGTPQESFPAILQEEVRPVTGDDGAERMERVSVEPLFADVRADSLRASLKKLRKTEYLRLAAAYFGCSYDALYKRRRRFLIRTAALCTAGIVAAAAGFSLYAHLRNRQYATARALSFATHAQAQLEQGDEMTALSLCYEGLGDGKESGAAHYFTALRSALVQSCMKRTALPVARTMVFRNNNLLNPVLYISQDKSCIFCFTDYYAWILDAKTGSLINHFPANSIAVDTNRLTFYVKIDAQRQADGTWQDVLTLCTLDGAEINSFAFRPSTGLTPAYRLSSYPGAEGLYSLEDHDQTVAWLTDDGRQLTQQQALSMAQAAAPAKDAQPPFTVTLGNKVLRKKAAVKDAQGNMVMQLEDTSPQYSFSSDYRYFILLSEDAYRIYDTATWQQAGQVSPGEGPLLQSLLLKDTHYLLCTWRTQDNWSRSTLYDWRSGASLITIDGYAYADEENGYIYSMEQGQIAQYSYREMDTANKARVLAMQGDLALTDKGALSALINVKTRQTLLQEKTDSFLEPLFADDLSVILIPGTGSLRCLDSRGTLLWEKALSFPAAALSADGTLAAYEDEKGDVQVANAKDGTPLYAIPARVFQSIGTPSALAVHQDGVFIAAYNQAVWVEKGTDHDLPLGNWDRADFSIPGHILLSSTAAYVQDMALWSMEKQQVVWQPESNTGLFTLTQDGTLVRHLEAVGNRTTFQAEVLRWDGNTFRLKATLELPEKNVLSIRADTTGKYLSINTETRALVWQLDNMEKVLELTGTPLFYENGALYSLYAWDNVCPGVPYPQTQALEEMLLQALTGNFGLREMTAEEKERYTIE